MTQSKNTPKTTPTLKTYLLTGILVTAPITLTIWLAWEIASYFDTIVIGLLPDKYNPFTYLPYSIPGLGIVLLLLFLIIVGMLTASYFGRITSNIWKNFIQKMPLISGVYNALRKIFETILGKGQGHAFRQAVLVEFPRKDMWTIAFIAGETYAGIQDKFSNTLISVYVPTTPNPTSGYFVYVPQKDIIPLDIGVDEAFKMIISTGIVNPEHHKIINKKKKNRKKL